MGFFSKIGHALKNEISHTENLFHDIVHNPAKSIGQFALGAGDPLSSKMWNKVLGTHYHPLVGQLGGETDAQFKQSEAQGVDTSEGRALGHLANSIASKEAGQYLSFGIPGLSGVLSSAIDKGTERLDGTSKSTSTNTALATGVGTGIATGTGTGIGAGMTTDTTGTTTGTGSGVDWSSVIGGLGSLYSGMSANHQASGLQSILNNSYSFNASRPMYAAELNQLMADPEKTVTSSPGYKAEMDQALQASQRTAAAQGLTGSGTEAAALAFTGAQTEQSAYDKLFSQLSMLSGATLDPAKMFGEQMSVDQTKQGGSGGVFSGLSSMGSLFKGTGGGGGSGGGSGLGSWFSNLFSSGSTSSVGDAVGGSGGIDMSDFASLGG